MTKVGIYRRPVYFVIQVSTARNSTIWKNAILCRIITKRKKALLAHWPKWTSWCCVRNIITHRLLFAILAFIITEKALQFHQKDSSNKIKDKYRVHSMVYSTLVNAYDEERRAPLMSNCLCDAWLLVPHSLCYHLQPAWFPSFSSFPPFSFFIPSITTMSWKGIGCKMYAQTSGLALSVSMTLVTQRGNNGLLAKCQLQVWFRDEKKGGFLFLMKKKNTWNSIKNIYSWPFSFFRKLWRPLP